jgi:anti-sigma factor RsiW
VTEPNAPHVQEEQLHRYFDGELSGGDAATVRGHLGTCGECTARHTALSELRRMITVAAEQTTLEVDFDRAFVRIEREVRAQHAQQGLFERFAAWIKTTLQERPEQLWAPALGAAAAAALLISITGNDEHGAELAEGTMPEMAPSTEVAAAGTGVAAEGAAGAGLPADARLFHNLRNGQLFLDQDHCYKEFLILLQTQARQPPRH